ncbi:MAG: hypothetical protein ACYDEG_03355, partial [bacterium]
VIFLIILLYSIYSNKRIEEETEIILPEKIQSMIEQDLKGQKDTDKVIINPAGSVNFNYQDKTTNF